MLGDVGWKEDWLDDDDGNDCLVGEENPMPFLLGDMGVSVGGVGKFDSVKTEAASDGALCRVELPGAVWERPPNEGTAGKGEEELTGERDEPFCGKDDGGTGVRDLTCCGKEDCGAGDRRSDGGGASSRLRSRSVLRGDRGRANDGATVVCDRVGSGRARVCACGCACAKAD